MVIPVLRKLGLENYEFQASWNFPSNEGEGKCKTLVGLKLYIDG